MNQLLVNRIQDKSHTHIMGILNVTLDSFYDGGRYLCPEDAAAHVEKLVSDGADILDVGAESSRPGSVPVDVAEELTRILPAINAALASGLPVSVDTRHAETARQALELGAIMINDITGMRDDPEMFNVIADFGCACVIMHMQGAPQTMQDSPRYDDVVGDICTFFSERVDVALSRGVREDRIWLDPGFGFGKTVEHNLEMLRRFEEFRQLGLPLLLGTSNKSTIGAVLDAPPDDRLEGTAATVAIAACKGVHCVRVHDVKFMARMVRMCDAVLRGRKQNYV